MFCFLDIWYPKKKTELSYPFVDLVKSEHCDRVEVEPALVQVLRWADQISVLSTMVTYFMMTKLMYKQIHMHCHVQCGM